MGADGIEKLFLFNSALQDLLVTITLIFYSYLGYKYVQLE